MTDVAASVSALFANFKGMQAVSNVFDVPRGDESLGDALTAASTAEDAVARLVLCSSAETMEEAVMQMVIIGRLVSVMEASDPKDDWGAEIALLARGVASVLQFFERRDMLPAGFIPADIMGTGLTKAVGAVRSAILGSADDALASSR